MSLLSIKTLYGAALLSICAAAWAQPVPAAAYTHALPASSVSFSATQMGVPMKGHFKTLTTQIDFMPGDLAKSHVEVAVQSASVDAGSAQTNALLAGADWLAAKADPQARFVSSQFTPDGPGRYWVSGTFSVKGHSQPLRVQVSTHPDGKDLIMDAAFTLDRTAFGLGTGSWADTSVVAAAIAVQVHLVVSPQ
ncbi:MAG: polyisoprenoid-binding protein [Betaproteobacteria bacterium]|nr:polyisoprenoid-binding protein [Betaproteobacteria bacterium]MDE2270026.1 polyisoprenoid-binding protein [Betaproteobacteria bacterium]